MAKRDEEVQVSKAEFVGLMVLVGLKDRPKYREMRERGWNEAIPPESESPN